MERGYKDYRIKYAVSIVEMPQGKVSLLHTVREITRKCGVKMVTVLILKKLKEEKDVIKQNF